MHSSFGVTIFSGCPSTTSAQLRWPRCWFHTHERFTQTALGIIVPLLVISYLTYKTSLGRIEDAHRHVEEVNQLYLSTIETLATAIDAKDQVTSGHIRRVQRFTLGLAKELGVEDRSTEGS